MDCRGHDGHIVRGGGPLLRVPGSPAAGCTPTPHSQVEIAQVLKWLFRAGMTFRTSQLSQALRDSLSWRKPEAPDTFQSPLGSTQGFRSSLSLGQCQQHLSWFPHSGPSGISQISPPCVHDVSKTRTLWEAGKNRAS